VRVAHAQSQNFPEFTIETDERSSGGQNTKRSIFQAQRADGSRAEGELQNGVLSGGPRHLSLIDKSMKITVSDDIRGKTTWYYKDAPARRWIKPDSKCGMSHLSPRTKPTYLGDAQILGFRTVMIQTEYQVGTETFVNVNWQSPDLDCRSLKVAEDRRDASGNVTGHFESEAVRVILGTPALKLFEVPPEYSEMSPSHMRNVILEKSGDVRAMSNQHIIERLDREDKSYYENHSHAGVP
jgi:hypothetical protein